MLLILTFFISTSCKKETSNSIDEIAIKHLEANSFKDISISKDIPDECPTGFQYNFYFSALKVYNYRKTYTIPAKGCIYWNNPSDIKIHALVRY